MSGSTAGRTSVLLRSFAIQASWNYRTLIGTGFAFALLPVLKAVYGPDREALERAVRRHALVFNSHPYLAGMALGAVARLEADGEDPATIDRFKAAVRGSLGTLGDRLVWAGWRPVCLLLGLLVLFAGAPWWAAAGGFLLLYNVGHVALRIWSFRLGLESGKAVGERLRSSLILPAQRLLGLVGPFLVGATLPLAMAGGGVGTRLPALWALAGAVAGVIGLRLGTALRLPLTVFLLVFALTGLLAGLVE